MLSRRKWIKHETFHLYFIMTRHIRRILHILKVRQSLSALSPPWSGTMNTDIYTDLSFSPHWHITPLINIWIEQNTLSWEEFNGQNTFIYISRRNRRCTQLRWWSGSGTFPWVREVLNLESGILQNHLLDTYLRIDINISSESERGKSEGELLWLPALVLQCRYEPDI